MSNRLLAITKNNDGTVTITTTADKIVVPVGRLTPERKIEAVKAAMLSNGYVYTSKIDKKVKKALGI